MASVLHGMREITIHIIDSSMASQNLGQVAGLWIGGSAPVNTTLIWYDDTPAIRCHKVYSESAQAWVVLDQNTISAITYSELKNLAQNVGLTQGSWYKITDQGNMLALAITSTKVQYTDINTNFVIDDLAASATYIVTSSNLLIDDLNGAWDMVNKKLKFNFEDTAQDNNTGNDFVLGKKQRNGIWSLAKYRLSSLVSSITGNALSWNRGVFFNFDGALASKIDTADGIVSSNTYTQDMSALTTSIQNVAEENQQILAGAMSYTDDKTTDAEIYAKKLPSAPTSGTAIDIAQGDMLSVIVNKIHRWIAQFKFANGIRVSQNFASAPEMLAINNNDTVDSALRKTQFYLGELSLGTDATAFKLGSGYQPANHKPMTPGQTTIGDWMENSAYWDQYRQTFDYVIGPDDTDAVYPIAKLGQLGNVTVEGGVKSVLVKKGTYNYVSSGTVGISINYIMNNNVKVVFEPGVTIRVTKDPSSGSTVFTLFRNTGIMPYDINFFGGFYGNGCQIFNDSTGTTLNAFYSTTGIHDFLINTRVRLNECRGVYKVVTNALDTYIFNRCQHLYDCVGSFYACSYMTRCSVTFVSDGINGDENYYVTFSDVPAIARLYKYYAYNDDMTGNPLAVDSTAPGGFNTLRE